MDLMLKNKVALVTGAGQGVGRQIALSLAAEGCHVTVNDLFADRAEAVAAQILELGGKAIAVPANICDPTAVHEMFETSRSALGQIDILVNNAGVPVSVRDGTSARTLFYQSTIDEQIGMVDLNVHGTLYCCREALSDMVSQQHGGKIVNIVSEAGRAGEAFLATYSAAKAAIVVFTKSLALEHGKHAINVNAIALGAVSHGGIKHGPLNPDLDHKTNETWQKMAERYPMARGLDRLGIPEDVAAAVSFLVSDQAAFITGQTLGVNGGFYMP